MIKIKIISDMGDMDTIDIAFELAIACENLAAAVYREFMKKFSHMPEVVEFWNDMVRDEEKHAEHLEELYNSLTPDQLNAQANSQTLLELRTILTLKLEDVTGPIKTLDDAINTAHELENSEVNTAFRFLMNEFISAETRLNAIINTVEVHLERLMNFSEYYGDCDWRKSITAR